MKKWNVEIKKKTGKKLRLLPESVRSSVFLLKRDLEMHGPSTGGTWKNYSKLTGVKGDKRHCHLSSGKPTYVCCWEVISKQLKIMEVYYAGTHEKAPY